MIDAEVVESNTQFISMWRVLAGDRPGAELIDRAGLAIRWADSPFVFWNAIFLTTPVSEAATLADRLAAAAAYMRTRRQAGLIFISEDYVAGPAKWEFDVILAKEKLEFALNVRGMVGDILPFPSPVQSTLRFVRVADETTLRDYADLNSEGYGFSLEAGRAGLAGSKFWKETAYAYVGYEDDEPVSAAAAIVNDGLLFLALVATKPTAQRKGYGEATVRYALQAAHEATGLSRTLLHATDAGFPVYRRIGYHFTTKFLTYRLAP
ncbi:MAG TPA: GNAT family N-acetyltransferase [Aliidongia sp.]|nr:GNAT family N-acetyltransferase [Aliidongia sp.]